MPPPPPKNVKVIQHQNEQETKKRSSTFILGASIHLSRSVEVGRVGRGLLFGNAIFHGRVNVQEGFSSVCFLWLSLPSHYRVTDEALLAETT